MKGKLENSERHNKKHNDKESLPKKKTIKPLTLRNDPQTTITLRLLVELVGDGRTLKKESSRPCVVVLRALVSFLHPLRILSSAKPFSSHMYFISSSSFGSFHLSCVERE